MFNSQRINTDPKPWLVHGTHYAGERRARQDMKQWLLAPRPAFDNKPNPILVDFRRFASLGLSTVTHSAAVYLEALGDPEVENEATHSLDTLYETPYRRSERKAHEAHARKVLARLAAL